MLKHSMYVQFRMLKHGMANSDVIPRRLFIPFATLQFPTPRLTLDGVDWVAPPGIMAAFKFAAFMYVPAVLIPPLALYRVCY